MFTSLYQTQTYYYLNLLSNFPKFSLYSHGSTFDLDNDDPRLFSSAYQCQYKKNYDSLKPEFQDKISQTISFVVLKKFAANRLEQKKWESQLF